MISGFLLNMAIFDNIIQGLDDFTSNYWGHVAEAINNNDEAIAEINTDRLFKKGTDSEGEKLRNKYASYKVYSPSYTKKKKRLGLYNGHVNLKLSGRYLGSWEVKANDTEVTIDVNAENADLDAVLQDLYGMHIQGLTEIEWVEVVIDFILPHLLAEFRKIFN